MAFLLRRRETIFKLTSITKNLRINNVAQPRCLLSLAGIQRKSPNSLLEQCKNANLNIINAVPNRNFHSLSKNHYALKQSIGSSNSNCPIRIKTQINLQLTRNVTLRSKMGKRKSVKAVRKRFFRLEEGNPLALGAPVRSKLDIGGPPNKKLLYRWRAGMQKGQWKKSNTRKKRLRGPVLVTNKTQLKTLNKMMGNN